MKSHNKEDSFHRFIQTADKLPPEAHLFPCFDYMDQSIRKHFHQLKKTNKGFKSLTYFEDLWGELDS